MSGLAHCESFSPSRADFFPEMKLKASFSAMSQFAVLALTQLSKVLKGIDLLFVSSMVLKETISATYVNGLDKPVVVRVLLIMSPSPCLWLIPCLK